MNKTHLLGLALAVASLAGAVQAQEGPSRAQVAAETQAARKAGAIPHGDLDISSSNPSGDVHPAQSAVSTLTRAQVKAELAQAVADGAVPLGEIGLTAAEMDPARYAMASAPGLTRDEVRRELAKAQRDGDVAFGETGRTPAEQNPSRYAKARAQDGLTRYAGK